MRAEARAIAAREALRAGSVKRDAEAIAGELERVIDSHRSLRRIRIETCNGALLGERERPIDAGLERSLLVRRAIGADDGDEERPEEPQVLVATFAAPRARLDELEAVQAFAQAYHRG
ncbi:hypothetical protein ACMHYB_60730 [Sorangium sp. So ce1128]